MLLTYTSTSFQLQTKPNNILSSPLGEEKDTK